MPDNFDHFQYQGSLTTPPCTEGVSWYVLANAVQMSADQVSALRGAHGQSSRMLQSLGARTFKVESQMHSH
jgi:carbonic anhydrase